MRLAWRFGEQFSARKKTVFLEHAFLVPDPHIFAEFLERESERERASERISVGPDVTKDGKPLMFAQSPSRLTFTVHYLTNESIEVTGERAAGSWKLFEPCTVRDRVAVWQGGRYEDEFERRGGEWRFTRMTLFLEYRTPYDEGWLQTRFADLP